MPEAEPPPRALAALVLLAAPYLLNDVANICVRAPIAWLACDYGSRVFSLACLVWLCRRGVIARSDFQLHGAAWWRLAGGTLAATLGGLLLLVGPGRTLLSLLPQSQVGVIPDIAPPWLHAADYWGGIALVALSEELVFRGAFPRLIARVGGSPWIALLASSAVFGLAHWSLGIGSILQTALVGLLFGLCAAGSRSLWPVIIAHYVVDLVAFG